MKLEVLRYECGPVCTIGKILIDGEFACFTLEDVVRPAGEPKVFGQTAIPYGVYEVVITFSNHFKRDLPLLLGVPGFEGVRIHPGNTAADTEGCLLLGLTKGDNFVGQSRAAFDLVFPKIRDAIESGEKVTIEYREG